MVLTGVAVLVAIGFGVWAVKVHSDLDDQRAATQAAEEQAAAQAEAAAAVAAEVEEIAASNEIFVVSNEDVAQAESEVAAAEEAVAQANAAAAEASSAVSTAQGEASKLRAELEQARAERDLARAERQQARVCARGSLGALSAFGRGDAKATRSSRPSQALAPPLCPDRRQPYARSSRHGTSQRSASASTGPRGQLRAAMPMSVSSGVSSSQLRRVHIASTAPIHAGSALTLASHGKSSSHQGRARCCNRVPATSMRAEVMLDKAQDVRTPIVAREGIARGAAKSTRRRTND